MLFEKAAIFKFLIFSHRNVGKFGTEFGMKGNEHGNSGKSKRILEYMGFCVGGGDKGTGTELCPTVSILGIHMYYILEGTQKE
jgi:hypothetical protein